MFRVLAVLFMALVSANGFAQQAVPQFTILPFAGVPRNIGDNQQAVNALLTSPYGVAADRAGDLYVADSYGARVLRILASGTVTVFAGTGVPGNAGVPGRAGNAQLFQPHSVAVDSSGNVFILDS